ncbi:MULTISPECIES: GDSL-type esterase/lipase family protein [unclassified Crossiella]|uniref:GDSL-type esterase/lipase family protein n=1 Tax=unclassified Crossiella TaxID=2620835 RepID=UPI001FFF6B6C|nr:MULTISPECIES: GDSL-type esterase/lipase family protein [unclassified Crossiella]MCK2242873.1 GDSL-type esterase/lipase family protein [Crossiella sp. S99.2]MCK2256750.1 GDSL-type esterase/lipase family protein [Crossiella sp. S99.1]
MVTIPITAELLRGALDLEPTAHGLLPHRLPARARAQNTDGQLAMAEAQPSGVRLVFRTAATEIELDVLRTKLAWEGVPSRPDGVYDLLVNGSLAAQVSASGGNLLTLDMATGAAELIPGPVGTVHITGLSPEPKDLEIWLPHRERTELVALRANAPVTPSPSTRRTWLHHGSSISHGSDAASPSTTWPGVAAAHGRVELINLGFSGSALLDPFVARAIRDTPAELISLKLGINLVNHDVMRLRAFGPAVHGFLDTIREGHPDTPLLVVSPILCPIHEHTPGPCLPELSGGELKFRATGEPGPGKLTLTNVREELARITTERAAEDPNLHYLDGRELYGEADLAELPLPDDLHPDAATHQRIGDRFGKLAFASAWAAAHS